ncbi:hypothetical protein [Blastochloris tepida]|uniref:Uncharacterized protein n=1 Tax=Blastochloris tepida TaxID=2233851 RepID=A0A348G1F2_9HYPH|nr:hypothetical protein [Blastochloris tepida]BBF93385.1 hypothetical protein BLTE_20700 [Blastochloris tepida]
MAASWPPTVPQSAVLESYVHVPVRNVERFEPDSGPPIERRTASVACASLSFDTMMTTGQLADLRRFYLSTLQDGVLPFDRVDPVGGETIRCKFADVYAPRRVAPDRWRVGLSFLVLP